MNVDCDVNYLEFNTSHFAHILRNRSSASVIETFATAAVVARVLVTHERMLRIELVPLNRRFAAVERIVDLAPSRPGRAGPEVRRS